MRKSLKRQGGALLAASITSAALLVGMPHPAGALSGMAIYTPAESNISGKYWVSATASSGDASLALDGSAATAWVATSQPATLTVDLGGAYDAIHKVETVFASNRTVYKYRLQGSRDAQDWTELADRAGNTRPGGIFTDVFDFKGLRYLRLVIDAGSPVGVREFNVINYLRPDMDNGSDTSEQGGNTTTYYTTINDIPNNAGTGVWPWAGTNVFATGSGANGTLRASFKVWNDAFARNVVESHVFTATQARVAPSLPTTVTSLDLRTGARSAVKVAWSPVDPANYAKPGTFTVNGTANLTDPGGGRGTTMTAVKATVDVT